MGKGTEGISELLKAVKKIENQLGKLKRNRVKEINLLKKHGLLKKECLKKVKKAVDVDDSTIESKSEEVSSVAVEIEKKDNEIDEIIATVDLC